MVVAEVVVERTALAEKRIVKIALERSGRIERKKIERILVFLRLGCFRRGRRLGPNDHVHREKNRQKEKLGFAHGKSGMRSYEIIRSERPPLPYRNICFSASKDWAGDR